MKGVQAFRRSGVQECSAPPLSQNWERGTGGEGIPDRPNARTPERLLTLLVVGSGISEGETGGAELQARYLGESWAERGHRVHLVPVQMARESGGSEAWGSLRVDWLEHAWYSARGRREFAGILRAV